MKSIKYLSNNSDFFGVLVCSLCLIHCISWPLILISFLTLNKESSVYYNLWGNLDYVFVLTSFFMVYFSAKITKSKTMKYLFWFSWFTLFLIIINEKTELFQIPEFITYFFASLLAFFHLYNMKYCK
ncbi:MAG: MerC domain-containing protein [Flavobacteriales bacterium TMED235]|nr:MAG: MerC domain-containing protein [Flavobacteriales bacterium TMED235]